MEVNYNKPELTVTTNESFCGRIDTSSCTAFNYERNMNAEIAWFVSIGKLHKLVKIWEAYEDLQRQNGPQNTTKNKKLKIRTFKLSFLIPAKSLWPQLRKTLGHM